jgi:hypothetical protein
MLSDALLKYFCIIVIEVAGSIEEEKVRINFVTHDVRVRDLYLRSLKRIGIEGARVSIMQNSKRDKKWKDKYLVRISGRERFEAILKNYPFSTEKRRMIAGIIKQKKGL